MATRQNYGTYIPVEAIDWGKAIGGLYKTVNDIGESREKERQALDQLMTDSLNTINNTDMLKTQSLNDYVLAGAENGRSTIKSANDRLKSGQITPKEYKAIMNNVNTYWSTMGNSMKNFDATNQEILKRQQPGEDGSAPAGSEFEEFLAQEHANLGDLRNSTYQFNPETGEGYMVKIDPMTGTPQKITNSMAIADPSNIMDQRYDFDKEIMTFTRGLKNAYTMESDTVTLKDPMKRPEVANAVAAEITNLTGTPRMIGQFLARYGGFDFYRTPEQRDQIIMSEIQNENKSRKLQGKNEMTASEIENFTKNMSEKLIQVNLDNSNKYQPIITPEQQEEAEEILKDLIIAQFPKSQTEDEPRAPRRSSGSKSTYSADQKVLSLAQQVRDALSVTSGDQAAKNINQIVGGKNKRVKWTGNDFAIETYFPDEKPKDARGKDIRGSKAGIWKITTPGLSWQTSDFGDLFGYGSGGNKTKWEEAVDALGAQ
jgi:hypothetical protein